VSASGANERIARPGASQRLFRAVIVRGDLRYAFTRFPFSEPARARFLLGDNLIKIFRPSSALRIPMLHAKSDRLISIRDSAN